jgi:opacity protein-like surface antigen
MASKLTKIIAGATMLAVMAFNSSANAAGMTPGMMIGIGGDMLFAIKENTDTKYVVGDVPKETALVAKDTYTLSTKKDSGYGGNVSFGYLMDNGLAGELELGYRDIKYKDKVNKSTAETTNMTAILKGTYYIDLGSMIYPYVTAGAGIARVDAKGTIYNADATKGAVTPAVADTFVKFDSMKQNVLAYQAGAGITTTVGSAMLGAGYKFFGTYKMEDSKDHTDMTVADGVGGKFTNYKDFTFGKFTQNIHTIEIFAKMVM